MCLSVTTFAIYAGGFAEVSVYTTSHTNVHVTDTESKTQTIKLNVFESSVATFAFHAGGFADVNTENKATDTSRRE